MALPGQLAIFLANMVMFVRVLVVTALIDPTTALALALPLGLMAVVMLAGAGWKFLALRRRKNDDQRRPEAVALSNPFALLPALKWGVVLSVVLVASAVAQQHFGDRGLYITAAASGLADVDAVTLAVSRQSQQGTLAATVASLAITIAVVANTLVKATMAVVMGRKGFGRPIALVFAAAIAIGVVAAVLLRTPQG